PPGEGQQPVPAGGKTSTGVSPVLGLEHGLRGDRTARVSQPGEGIAAGTVPVAFQIRPALAAGRAPHEGKHRTVRRQSVCWVPVFGVAGRRVTVHGTPPPSGAESVTSRAWRTGVREPRPDPVCTVLPPQ